MGKRERGTDAFQRAEVAEDHGRLAGSCGEPIVSMHVPREATGARTEAEDGLVGLAPFFFEQAGAGGGVGAGQTLDMDEGSRGTEGGERV